jgi:hypothetical protein
VAAPGPAPGRGAGAGPPRRPVVPRRRPARLAGGPRGIT